MDEKDKFEAFMRLADFRMEVRKERRQLQWRLSLGLWIALAAGMIAFQKVQIPECLLALLLAAVVAGHAYLWVIGNWWRNERDAKQAYRMIAKAEGLLNVEYQPPRRRREEWLENMERKWGLKQNRLRIFADSPPFFEMLATVLLAAAWLIINVLGK